MKFLNLSEIIKKPYLLALSIVILLIKIPPFYFIPSIEKSSSFSLIRLSILASFFILFFLNNKKQVVLKKINPILLFLITIYFIGQSISIIYTSNISSFLYVYKDLVTGLLLFVTVLFITKEDIKILIKILLISTAIGIVYQYVFIFFPNIVRIIKPFLNIIYMQFAVFQSNRGRYFGDTMDEALIPIVFFYLLNNKKAGVKIITILILIAIIFLVILSGWRTKFIICLYAILASFFVFKQLKRYFYIFITIVIGIFIVSNSISLTLVGENVYDRFLFNNNPTETHIQNSRLKYLSNAYQIGMSRFITGVGLGNYYDNLSGADKIANQGALPNGGGKFITVDDPHNILFSVFSTTGIIGLISICSLLFYFFFTDMLIFLKNDWVKVFVIVFWGYFIFSFLNPWMYFQFLIPFWFFRGIIENIKLNQ